MTALSDHHQGYKDQGINTGQIFLASFLTLIAAGVGFAVRGGILGDWGTQFGFTKTELGTITGGGLVGFGVTIIICSLFADRIGYKALLVGALVLHLLSAVVTLAATPVYGASGKDATYWCLYIGMFMFALGNGLCEAAINPLVATLYPKQKTHYLNILHAGWPGGLIVGALFAYLFVGNEAAITHLRWEVPMAFFLVPTLWYGILILRNKFPISEAKAAGVSVADQIVSVLAPMLLFLFLIHAMVGYVELGTDSWITNIMNNTIPGKALLLFIYTSGLMFVLRFFAGPIVHKINPLGLLFISAVLGAAGLYFLGVWTSGAMIVVAATLFGIGKTFYWPTMLGVVGERFPKTGALGMGLMGGIGMLSAGLLGGPGIGYKQDWQASKHLKEVLPAEEASRYLSKDSNRFLFFPPIQGLDGKAVGAIQEKKGAIDVKIKSGTPVVEAEKLTVAEEKVLESTIYGGRRALQITALVPVTMAVCYLLLVIYFRASGGYKQLQLHDEDVPDRRPGEKYTGGVEAPVR